MSVPRRFFTELTADYLHDAYVTQQKSLEDIALDVQCTRQAVLVALRRHGIPTRSRSEARRLALRHGKFQYTDNNGCVRIRTAVSFDESFFTTPSPAMAWCLGVFFAEGCLQKIEKSSRYTQYIISISQKDPEILTKVLSAMSCNAKIYSTSSGLHSFSFHSETLFRQLQSHGLDAHTSSSIRFPSHLQTDLIPHFIRGCWDGDGSIYFEFRSHDTPMASYVSICRPFISAMNKSLHSLGLPLRTIYSNQYKKKNSPGTSYYFRFTGHSVSKLASVLYANSSDPIRLSRKFSLFKAAAHKYNVTIS